VVTTPRRGAREAILSYRTEAEAIHEGSTVTRVHVGLVTGRSHQIRVQFASRGTPLLGDGKYGSRVKCQYPALFAAGLSFPHPEDGRMMSFSAPVPGDFPWNLFGTSQYEIERKYLIAYPDTEKLGSLSGLHKRAITQTYLRAPVGVTRRVRRSEEEGRVSFVLTEKTRVNATTAVEEERVLSESAYLAELNGRDESRQPIEKTRYAFPFEGHTVEIDVYPFWQDRAILEVELEREDEEILLPSFIRVIREVTADKRYKNVSLAREVPMDEIC